jgi:tetratricopeptide (TPR) repeat protein
MAVMYTGSMRRIDAKRLRAVAFVFMGLAANIGQASGAEVAELLRQGDRAFASRAEGRLGLQASPAAIGQAIAAYRQALAEDPNNIEAYWKLLRSLTFEGHYATTDREGKQRIFSEGKRLATDALRVLDQMGQNQLAQPAGKASLEQRAQVLKNVPGAAETYYYASTIWAEWCLAYGVMAAVRQGAAAKIRDFATMASLIDDHVRYGGGYRALGRLHQKCPRIPFITGWISGRKALEYLGKAYQVDPQRKFNRVYYAEALYELDTSKRQEAIRMLEQVVADPPDEDLLIEDLNLQDEARTLLKTWNAK